MTTRPRSRLDTDPLTPNQLGAIRGGFTRLGFDPLGRPERLRLTAALARSGPVESTRELLMGEAGRVVNALGRCQTADQLYAMATPEHRGIVRAILAKLFG